MNEVSRRGALRTAASAVSWIALGAAMGKPAWAVRYGDVITPDEFSAVGLVTVLGEYPEKGIGTGTLVAPDMVVTAAHVIDRAVTPHHIKFNLDGQPGTASVVAVACPGEYLRALGSNTTTPAADIALLKLDRRLTADGIEYYPLVMGRRLADHEPGQAVGWGRDASGKLHIRTRGSLKFLKMRNNGCAVMVPGDEKNQITDSGDSGGPFLVKQNGRLGIAGIVQAKFSFEPDESYPGYDAIDLAQFAVVANHGKWIEPTLAGFEQLGPPASQPRYVRVGDLTQPRMPLSIRQVSALLKVQTSPNRVLAMIRQRGMYEPLSQTANRVLADAGASGDFLNALEKLGEPVQTAKQVLAMVRSNAPEEVVFRTLWKHGGLYGDLDEETARQLREAGAGRLVERLGQRF